MGAQVPTWLGVGVLVVGTPLILMDAARTSRELDALDAASSTGDARVEACIERTAHLISVPSLHRQVCECVVEKATARGVLGRYGSYDPARLEPITGACLRGDRD